MIRQGPAFAFWLNYLEHHGGLWEQSGDAVLTMLPGPLAARHDLPESALITEDPDVAREGDALFLGAGHPEIGRGAEAVVEAGDVGALTLPHTAKPISTDELLAKIRDQVPVDHGRIDATGSILRSHRPVLRLAALASHTVSADEQFTEVVECFLDVPSRVAWTADAAARLRHALGTADVAPGPRVLGNSLVPAVAAAHRELDAAAARRGRELSVEVDAERVAEIGRATEYYADALSAIDRRRDSADAGRQALLDARAVATVGERDRRLAEIEEKYRRQHVVRPFRLHLVDVPVWRLATDVRRGERRWPMVFDYLPLLGVPAPTRCPACGAPSPLVATKTQLVCASCAPPAPVAVPVRPVVEKPQPAASKKTPAPAVPTRDPRTTDRKRFAVAPPSAAAARRPFVPGRPEERKVTDFWNQVGAGETRKLSRLVAPESPLAALVRLYGATGPLHGIGVPAGLPVVSFTFQHYDLPIAGERGGTAGEVDTRRGRHPYLLLWSPDRLLDEILPYAMPWHPGRIGRLLQPLSEVPMPRTELDVVAQLLLVRVAARHGLTFAARDLAAWWRLPDADGLLARFSPRVLAATVDRAVRYWSGMPQTGYAEAAAVFGVDPDEMRKATAVVQKHLQLSSTRNW